MIHPTMASKRENFKSRWTVIMAMAGSAIGLGNIWRFPYMVGEHGGAAFIILYILATIFISLPVFMAEMTVGRRSRTSAYGAMSKLNPKVGFWKAAGILAIFIPTLIASYYSVIGGWSLEYLFMSCTGNIVQSNPDSVTSLFGSFISSPWRPVIVHLLFLLLCVLVVARGVRSGIEKFSEYTIPLLFVLIVLMAVYSLTLPGAMEGVKYLVKPDFSQLNARSLAYALGQSFYSLSLGMGTIITYGSYVSKKESIMFSGVGTATSDLMFAIIAGFAIMPAVFAAGIEPGAGPGLVFQSIPYIFASLGKEVPVISAVVSVIFFLTIVVAAMTSCISLLEVGVSYLVENHSMKRTSASLLLFVLCGTAGVFCSLSFGTLSGIQIGGMNLFDVFDYLSSNIFLPILATIVVIFVGFSMSRDDVRDEITNGGSIPGSNRLFPVVYFLIKWIAPIFMVLLFITNFIL